MNENVLDLTRRLCGDPVHSDRLALLDALAPAAVHKLVRYLGPFGASLRPVHSGKIAGVHRMSVARGLVGGAAELIAEWPMNLHKRFSEIQSSAPRSLSVRRTFSPMYRVLYHDLAEGRYQFSRDAFEGYLHEHWWGLVCKRNKSLQERTVKQHPRLTLAELAKTACVPQSVVRHLIQAELIPATTTELPSGRRSNSVHSSEVLRIKAATDGATSLQQAARMLKLSKRRLHDLIDEGVVTPLISRKLIQGASAWLISRNEIDRLYVRPTLMKRDTTAVTVWNVLKYWRLRESEGVLLIKAVLEGHLVAQTCGEELVPIGRVFLSAVRTKQWLTSCRASADESMSIDEAGKKLGIKQQATYDLVRLGLLRTVTDRAPGRHVLTSDIAAFRATYVSLADLALDEHCSPRALLRRTNATPVCGPTVNGARQYFYRRTDLFFDYQFADPALTKES